MNNERRYAVLGFELRDMEALIQGTKVAPGRVPEGARIVRMFVRQDSLTLMVIVEHESFEPVPHGIFPPHI